MIKKLICLIAFACSCSCALAASEHEQQAAMKVIQRFAGEDFTQQIELSSIPAKKGCPTYVWKVMDGKLHLGGSSGVAICKAFYDFVTSQGAGIASWSGNRFDPPQPLPEGKKGHAVSPVRHHQYFNVVTFGYTTAYWDWKRWEQEIDWMALHGIDMPLALVAQEAISARVFRQLGLKNEEIAAFFTGPAHLPWMRMGNISGHDGPLPQEWHEDQVALQHRILKRMRQLGMTPICPGFSGFVPEALQRVYPKATLTQTSWGGRFHNWMISPEDPLFSRISQMFIREWEKEFGKNSHYLMDSFNEMEIPFPPHGAKERYDLLARYGDLVYKALNAASPGSTWVMQGWMFGYQRDIWDPRTLEALISRVPKNKMLLLDMATDYNQHFWHNGSNYDLHKGFYGRGWVYSVIPNMGGKTGLTGMLDFYANGHLDALNSPNRGKLRGMGMAPEGIENNEVIYELVSSAGWRNKKIDLADWLEQYNRCRYGSTCPELAKYWQHMLKSVYGSFTDHPRYGWQMRPGGNPKGSINTNNDFHAAVEAFASCAEDYRESPLYCIDLVELAAFSIGGRIEELMAACQAAEREGQKSEAKKLDKTIQTLMLGMDKLLASHPTHSLQRWLNFARKHGSTDELKDYYEGNARRLVTIWGPPVDDYAAKVWSGLIRDYYLPRWKQYRKNGGAGLADWERNWVEEQRGVSSCKPFSDPVDAALSLLKKAKAATAQSQSREDSSALAYWTPEQFGTSWQKMELSISPRELTQAKGLRFITTKGGGLEVGNISLIMDGQEVLNLKSPGKGDDFTCTLQMPKNARGNNECRLIIRARNPKKSSGRIEWVAKE